MTGDDIMSDDIEQSLARERNLLRTLIDNLPDLIYAKDSQSRYILNNLAHLQFLGAGSPENAIGKTIFDFLPKDLAETFYQQEQAMMASERPIIGLEQRTANHAGNEYWVSETKVPLRDETGKVVGLVGMSRDISDRRRFEQQLLSVMAHARCILWHADIRAIDGDDSSQGGTQRFSWALHVKNEEAAQQILPLNVSPDSTYAIEWVKSRDPQDALEIRERSSSALSRKESSYNQEFRCIDRFGQLHWLFEDVHLEPAGIGAGRPWASVPTSHARN